MDETVTRTSWSSERGFVAEALRRRAAEIHRELAEVGFMTTHEEIDRSKHEGRL